MEIIISIVGKIGEYSVGPIGEQFGYLISYKNRIMILEEKLSKLCQKKEAVQQSVDGAQWNQEVVSSEVETWLTNVGKEVEEVRKFLEEDVKTNRMYLNGWCPDLKLRYSLGKKAQKNTRAIVELLEEGEKYDRIFNIAPPLKARSSSTERFKDFESRKAMIRNVLEALRDEKIDMIALCGMGGIGKTEMTKEIARRVKANGLFHEVATAVVSQSPNLTKIQGELAEMLGPRLNAESLCGRAKELYTRLTKNKSVLVILDDVWERLDLEDIGVYDAIKEKSCKILLTSRSEETCNQMRIQQIFPIGFLSEKEAWNLFREMASDCINTPNLISIAEQIVKECALLPIAIVTVGSALSNKRYEYEWKAALHQLKMSIPQNITDLHPKVYSSIELSYNYLGSDEAKSYFLLCCLYPEDYDIPIEHLVRYGVAKRFLKGFSTVEQIREYVNTIVLNLQRSNLLLGSQKKECVKMHDIVRDVAILITSKEEHGFMVELDRRLEEWPQRDTYDNYTTISLLLGEMKGHPNGLKYPKLQFLRLSYLKDSKKFPDNLFNGMNELKMLSLQEGCFSSTSLPPSIQILENLRMLNLESCRLGDVSAIGSLGRLEILSFRNSKIEELPREIGNLSQLKLLDMKGCRSLKRIAVGVLSRLSRLEELYMGEFINWQYTTMMEGNGEGTSNNASLDELIRYFGQKTILEISIPSIECLPKGLDFSNSKLRFRINITDGRYLFENTIFLKPEDASHDHWKVLENRGISCNLKRCHITGKDEYNSDEDNSDEDLSGEDEYNSDEDNSDEDLSGEDEYNSDEDNSDEDLSGEDEYNSDEDNSDEDLSGEDEYNSDEDQVTLTKQDEPNVSTETENQTKMLSLFPYYLIQSLENLEILEARRCDSVEVIFELEGLNVEESNILNNLTKLRLFWLPKLLHIWKKGPRDIKGFNNLRLLSVQKCHSLKCLFTPSIAKLLVKLEEIKVSYCNEMEEIIAKESGDEEKRDHCNEAIALEWPSIKKIILEDCPKLKTFGTEVQSERKLRKKDVELDARAPHDQPTSAGSSSASTRESSRLFNRCLELSCIPRPRTYNPDQENCISSSEENKHNFNKDQVTLTKQDEPNVSTVTQNQTKMWALFPYNLMESLKNLEHLNVDKCGSLEVIFELEGLNVEEINYILNNLTELRLGWLSKLLHIWKKGPRDIKGFNNLRLLQVLDCHSLKCLFTPSIAKLLVKLEEIKVRLCDGMEEIIAKESGDKEKRDHVIAFPHLKTLELVYLPKLECFCNEAISFEWPSIKKIELWECPKLKTFGSEIQNGRKLRKKDLELDAMAPHDQSSASSSSASARESSRLFNRCLELSCIPRPRTYNPDQENCISSSEENKHNFNKDQVTLTNQDEPNVSTETQNQTKMSSLFPYYLIPSLENLEILEASYCGSLEVIFELEGLNVEESNYIINNLTKLNLHTLPKLLHIWKKGPRDIKGFNNLRLLEVLFCKSLKCLFTPSIAKLLVKLEQIEVRYCIEMEEIIAKESGDEEKRDHVIAFPQVKTLQFWNLPKLECFCNEAISLEWPSLGKLTVDRCEKLKPFVSTSMKTPKLKGVHTKYDDVSKFQPMIEGDLNTTIQHIIKGKANLREISQSSKSP